MPPMNAPIVSPLTLDSDGVMRIGHTRVSLAGIVAELRNGNSAETIAHDFPSLSLADVNEVIANYRRHQESLDVALAEEDAALDRLAAPFKAAAKVNQQAFLDQLRKRARRDPTT